LLKQDLYFLKIQILNQSKIVKKLIESFPKQIDFNEFATNDKANIEGTNILLEVIDEHNKGVR
jgi:hypothetical protein